MIPNHGVSTCHQGRPFESSLPRAFEMAAKTISGGRFSRHSIFPRWLMKQVSRLHGAHGQDCCTTVIEPQTWVFPFIANGLASGQSFGHGPHCEAGVGP